MKEQDVTGGEWDVLIVLDAARYDVFADVYSDYLDGTLERRRSPASSTPEWAVKMFPEEYDITYISANPFINGTGIALDEMPWGGASDYAWTAAEHFREVIDVWDAGWDDDAGTVPASAVTTAVQERLPLQRRTIVHYLQPHAPFLDSGSGWKTQRIQAALKNHAETERVVRRGLLEWAGTRAEQSTFLTMLAFLLELHLRAVLRAVYAGPRAVLMEYYTENLRLALDAVADLVENVEGDVVVTADHGEAFGEEGVWEHHTETHIPALTTVPWLRVEQ